MYQAAPSSDLTYVLPRHLYYQVIHTLRLALPPPASDAPQDLLNRDRAAIAQIGSMLPANGEEAMLAAQVVAANAQALDCLRLVRRHASDTALGLRCTAQAASMMRQANATRSLLLRVQARRQKQEADAARCDAAARVEHCAVGLMSDALDSMPLLPPPPPAPPPPASPLAASTRIKNNRPGTAAGSAAALACVAAPKLVPERRADPSLLAASTHDAPPRPEDAPKPSPAPAFRDCEAEPAVPEPLACEFHHGRCAPPAPAVEAAEAAPFFPAPPLEPHRHRTPGRSDAAAA